MKPFYLHPAHQAAAIDEKRFQVLVGGRGGMKTEAVARIFIARARAEKDIKILCTRKFQASVKDSVHAVISQAISDAELDSEFEIEKASIRHKHTGAEFMFYGLQHIMEIKSMKGIKYCWIEEAQFLTGEILEILSPTLRIKGAQIFMVFNPNLETDWIYQTFIVADHPMANIVWTSYLDNPFFTRDIVGSSYDEMEYDKELNLDKYNHKWLGHCKKEVEGALWSRDMIKYIKKIEYEELLKTSWEKIIVAVDPSVGDNLSKIDECGIVVAGLYKGKYYILEDASLVATPNTWANKVVAMHNKWKANSVVAEGNQGQALINSIINNIDRSIRITRVNARRGKYVRAEPIAALYEQDLVRHIKPFTEMESELVSFTGSAGEKSPNRLDALVWALTSLSKVVHIQRGTVAGNMGTMRLRQNYR